jgi:hypothetical protein
MPWDRGRLACIRRSEGGGGRPGLASGGTQAYYPNMSSHTFACFDCRTAVRRRIARPNNVRCPECRQACTWLGTTISVPPRSKPKQWSELRGRLLFVRDCRQLAALRSRFSGTRSFDDMYRPGK